MKTVYQYLVFIETSNPNGKTRIFQCLNKKSEAVLGLVKWYGACGHATVYHVGGDGDE